MIAKVFIAALAFQVVASAPQPIILDQLFNSFTNTLDTVKTAAAGFGEATKNAMADVRKNVQDNISTTKANVGTFVDNTKASAAKVMDATGQLIGNGIEFGANVSSNGLISTAEGIKGLNGISKKVNDLSVAVGNAMADVTGATIETVGDLSKVASGLVNSGMESVSAMADRATALGNQITTKVGSGISKGLEAGSNMVAGVFSTVAGTPSKSA